MTGPPCMACMAASSGVQSLLMICRRCDTLAQSAPRNAALWFTQVVRAA